MNRHCIVYTGVVLGEEDDPANATGAIAETVLKGLAASGWTGEHRKFDGDLKGILDDLRSEPPAAIFNLVESYLGTDRLAYIAAGLFEASGLPFTGSGAYALLAAADKILAKTDLAAAGVSFPAYSNGPDWAGLDETKRYIVKAAGEHASLDIDQSNVVRGRASVIARAARYKDKQKTSAFAEEFVEGREFNIAILEVEGEARVLPLAEMTFNFPPGAAHIITTEAKWKTGAPDYEGTVRRFLDPKAEPELAAALQDTALRVWRRFRLGGFARIDMRVGADGRPMVIDVNVNPDISDDAGMAAAAGEAGYDYPALLSLLIDAGIRRAAAA